MPERTLPLVLTGMATLLAGCLLAPPYSRPSAPVPAAWPSGPAYAAEDPAAAAAPGRDVTWRRLLPDQRLQRLIEMALANNRDLRVAALNVERARAIYGIQRAELLPAVSAVGSESWQRVPGDLSGSGKRETLERWDANLGLVSWELDFFGRIRSLRDRAMQEYLATEQAHRSAETALVSTLASTYLALAADREMLRLAGTTLTSQKDAYQLAKQRCDQGMATDLDVHRAQTQVDTALVDVARYTQRTAQDGNLLDLLAGTSVPGELLPADLASVTPFADIAASLPSEVLLERPDVLQAEALLKAANADIGAARAAFFPRVSLTAAAGTASADLSGLFDPGSGAWSYAPRVTLPIFDARIWSAHRAAKVQREIAVTQYERAVQIAFREVADALALRGTVGSQVNAQESLVQAVDKTYRLANTRYDKGLDSYLSVLDAQRSLYAAQQGLVSLRLAQATSLLTLYRALGGG